MSLTSTKCLQKGFNTQHCLLLMIEKWCKSLYVGGHTTAVLTDLSKIFHCMIHELPTVFRRLKFSSFLILLTKTQTNMSYSKFEEIISGTPQRSILGPLAFNICICEFISETENLGIACYLTIILILLVLLNLMKFDQNNCFKLNFEKCHLLTNSMLEVDAKVFIKLIKIKTGTKLWLSAKLWLSCLHVFIMSRMCFRVSPHSIVVWMSRNSLLEAGAKSKV